MDVAELRRRTDVPVISAEHRESITSINERFHKAYGWADGDLVGQPLPIIVPRRFHDAHHSGFARFLSTESPIILGRTLAPVVSIRPLD